MPIKLPSIRKLNKSLLILLSFLTTILGFTTVLYPTTILNSLGYTTTMLYSLFFKNSIHYSDQNLIQKRSYSINNQNSSFTWWANFAKAIRIALHGAYNPQIPLDPSSATAMVSNYYLVNTSFNW